MGFFELIVVVVLVGIAVQIVTTYSRSRRFEVSRFMYLALGLVLMLPTTGYPLALMRELRNPNPSIHTFNLPLTLAFALGMILVIRAIRKPRGTRVGNIES